jgi:hypothetical protein
MMNDCKIKIDWPAVTNGKSGERSELKDGEWKKGELMREFEKDTGECYVIYTIRPSIFVT